jgi:hypothetical protein
VEAILGEKQDPISKIPKTKKGWHSSINVAGKAGYLHAEN